MCSRVNFLRVTNGNTGLDNMVITVINSHPSSLFPFISGFISGVLGHSGFQNLLGI